MVLFYAINLLSNAQSNFSGKLEFEDALRLGVLRRVIYTQTKKVHSISWCIYNSRHLFLGNSLVINFKGLDSFCLGKDLLLKSVLMD